MKALTVVWEFISSGTGRRLLVLLLGLLLPLLNKKLGLELDANALVADVVLVLGYIVQSAGKEAIMAHADAKMALADAVALNKPASPPSP
jgi:hypothetical protein